MTNKKLQLDTKAQNTWCPGCGNFGALATLKTVITRLIEEGIRKEDIVLVSGIGCSSKIIDYININSFSALHGRPIASAEGIKLANPNLKVIVYAGDGGTYNEGISHLIHAAKRNIDITVLISNNRTFALTTGQFTATSPKNFEGKSTPSGSMEEPFNPLKLVFAANGTFIARGYSLRPKQLENLFYRAIMHKGFSFVDILSPCVSFFNPAEIYNKKVYEVPDENTCSKKEAWNKINEWNYEREVEDKIPLGVFYQVEEPEFWPEKREDLNFAIKKEIDFNKFLKENH